jgi:hypothetical protein
MAHPLSGGFCVSSRLPLSLGLSVPVGYLPSKPVPMIAAIDSETRALLPFS